MPDSPFPPEVPKIDEAVRITPVKEDYNVRNYKDFCEESHVISRFFALNYEGQPYKIEVCLSGKMIPIIYFNQTSQSWSTKFDDQEVQVEVEKILE